MKVPNQFSPLFSYRIGKTGSETPLYILEHSKDNEDTNSARVMNFY